MRSATSPGVLNGKKSTNAHVMIAWKPLISLVVL